VLFVANAERDPAEELASAGVYEFEILNDDRHAAPLWPVL
jgi:hypothetical protein